MRRFVILFLVVAWFSQVEGQINLTRINESVYLCEDRFFAQENSMVYVGPEHVTIIGATWCPASAKALHDSIGIRTDKPVREVINTNYHPDRAGGNAFWKSIGCEIHATEKTVQLMREQWDSICDFTRTSIPELPEMPLVLPTCTHEGDFELQEGKIRVFFLGAAHTEDGVFVYLPDERVLYAGCILKATLGNLKQANLEEYPRTLRKLKQLDLDMETVVAGHGTPVHDAGLIDRSLVLLMELNETKSH